MTRRRKAHLVALALCVPIALMLWATYARAAILVPCRSFELDPTNWEMHGCQSGTFTGFGLVKPHFSYVVVRVEDPRGPWIFRDGVE